MVLLLLSDIGGTNSRFELLNYKPEIEIIKRDILPTQSFLSFNSILSTFLENQPTPELAVIGTEGVIFQNTVRFVNCPWEPQTVSGETAAEELNIGRLVFLNDFEAAGYGVFELGSEDLIQINPEVQKIPEEICVVLGPGTGIGECIMTWNGSSYDVWSSEGGNSDFAPKTELQFKYVQYMSTKVMEENTEFPQFKPMIGISYELGFGGLGVHHLYYFLKGEFPYEVDEEFDKIYEEDFGNRVKLLIEYGFEKRNKICERVVEMWEEALGYEVGNLIAKFLPYGGCYIAGGMFMKNAEAIIESGVFMEAVNSKPPHIREIISRVPIYVVKNLDLGFVGTLGYAKTVLQNI